MAAPLKAQSLARLYTSLRPCVCVNRYMSSKRDKRDDKPPAWAARQVPTGNTFYSMQLSKMQNREIWKRRMKYINRPWEKIVIDYKKRQEDTADNPPEDAPLLLMVRQVSNLWGVPYYLKDVLKRLGFKKQNQIVILKNKTLTCSDLRRVKHLVEIFPVTFPYGMPTSEEDLDHCYITDNGQFIVKKKLELVDQIEDIKVSDQLPENKYEMKQEHIDKCLEYRKMRYQISQEYFQTKYVYEKNQDKKEHRYKGDQNIGFDKIWH